MQPLAVADDDDAAQLLLLPPPLLLLLLLLLLMLSCCCCSAAAAAADAAAFADVAAASAAAATTAAAVAAAAALPVSTCHHYPNFNFLPIPQFCTEAPAQLLSCPPPRRSPPTPFHNDLTCPVAYGNLLVTITSHASIFRYLPVPLFPPPPHIPARNRQRSPACQSMSRATTLHVTPFPPLNCSFPLPLSLPFAACFYSTPPPPPPSDFDAEKAHTRVQQGEG